MTYIQDPPVPPEGAQLIGPDGVIDVQDRLEYIGRNSKGLHRWVFRVVQEEYAEIIAGNFVLGFAVLPSLTEVIMVTENYPTPEDIP